MHDNIAAQFVTEGLPPLTAEIRFRAVDTVSQFYDSHNRKNEVAFAV